MQSSSADASLEPSSDAAVTRFLVLPAAALAIFLGIAAVAADASADRTGALLLLVGVVVAVVRAIARCRGSLPEAISTNAGIVGLLGAVLVELGVIALFGVSPDTRRTPDRTAVLICCAVAAAGVIAASRGFWRSGALLLIGSQGVLGYLAIRANSDLSIDVWQFQQVSSADLLAGRNPYNAVYRNPYPTTDYYGPGVVREDGTLNYSFPYPPLSAILVVPGRIAGDVRYAHLTAMVLAAVLVVHATRSVVGVLSAGMILCWPRVPLILQASWTEPLAVLLSAAVVWAALRRPRLVWLALGLLLAVKQYMVLMVPLMLIWSIGPHRLWSPTVPIKALAVAAGVTMPFFLWDPTAFVRSVLLWQFVQPFRPDALSVPALVYAHTGVVLPSALGFLGAAAGTTLAALKLPRSHAGLLMGTALTLLLFVAMGKQAFANYYLVVVALAALAAAVGSPEPQTDAMDASAATSTPPFDTRGTPRSAVSD
jgi:hypothetical protein